MLDAVIASGVQSFDDLSGLLFVRLAHDKECFFRRDHDEVLRTAATGDFRDSGHNRYPNPPQDEGG